MPDVARRAPNWLEDPDAYRDDDVIIMQDGETSIRAAKLRLHGEPKSKLDTDRERVRCNVAAIDGPSCWSEAHETVSDNLGIAYDLCPPHAADLRAVVAEIEAEEASEAVRNGVYTSSRPKDALRADEDAETSDAAVEVPARRQPPEKYTPAAFAKVVEENRDKRYADRKARGIPTTNVRRTKSKLGKSKEYRRVEGRRRRARLRGLDPDTLGSRFRLPTRKTIDYEQLVIQEAERALANLPDVIEDDE